MERMKQKGWLEAIVFCEAYSGESLPIAVTVMRLRDEIAEKAREALARENG